MSFLAKRLLGESSPQLVHGLSATDWPQISYLLETSFPECVDWVTEWVRERTDDSMSLKVVDGEKILGVYALRREFLENSLKSCTEVEPGAEEYAGTPGLEGAVVVVAPEARGSGIGRQLIEASYEVARSNGLPYIFGEQMRGLNNLAIWKKRRKLMGSNSELYVTLADV